jgi:hypothetical protein
MRMRIPAGTLRDPWESEQTMVRMEPAPNCFGEECNSCVHADDGELEALRPHFHMLISGQNPQAGPHCYSVGVFDSE